MPDRRAPRPQSSSVPGLQHLARLACSSFLRQAPAPWRGRAPVPPASRKKAFSVRPRPFRPQGRRRPADPVRHRALLRRGHARRNRVRGGWHCLQPGRPWLLDRDIPGDGAALRRRRHCRRADCAKGHIVAIVASEDGPGYWLACSTGAVFAFGDAHGHGSARPARAEHADRRNGGNSKRRGAIGSWLRREGLTDSATPAATGRQRQDLPQSRRCDGRHAGREGILARRL